MKNTKRGGVLLLIFAVMLSVLPSMLTVSASDGAFSQSAGHEDEVSMYRYDFDIYLENPCNSNDMDEDAVYQLWFDFDYTKDNGYGSSGTYRFDMSWNDSRDQNLNRDILKKTFIRPNDTACMTGFSVWVPGIVKQVRVHLNMDGGERLSFTVESITLGGFRINTDTDYVSSAYYDSDATIHCHVPRAAILYENGTPDAGGSFRDQYGALFTEKNTEQALEDARYGDTRMIYHSKTK